MGNLGLLDDGDIVFDESDMDDPDLLSAFNDLGFDDDTAIARSTNFDSAIAEDQIEGVFDHPDHTQVMPSFQQSITSEKVRLQSAADIASSTAMTDLDRRLLSVSQASKGKKQTQDENNIEALRQKALSLKKIGKTDEAIACMRQVKALQGAKGQDSANETTVSKRMSSKGN
jgi:hypothetical protein